MTAIDHEPAPRRNPKWMTPAGWLLTSLIALMFLGGGSYALLDPAMMQEGSAKIGFPTKYGAVLAIMQIVIGALYLLPPTAVLGAVLLTGYLGGAACAHLRVDEIGPTFIPIAFGVVAWLGLFLRDAGVRTLLPIRRSTSRT